MRWYGPPLRETSPEDVGIDTHADMGDPPPLGPTERTLLREVEGGEFEEIVYEVSPQSQGEGLPEELADEVAQNSDVPPELEEDLTPQQLEELQAAARFGVENLSSEELAELEGEMEAELPDLADKRPNYVEAVARNQREADALQRLAADFETAKQKQKEAEDKATADEEENKAEETLESVAATSWPEEWDYEPDHQEGPSFGGREQRFHPWTVDGSFHGRSFEVALPKDDLVTPISDMLKRTHIDHVRVAAERTFGGVGLPLSPETLPDQRNGDMERVGLHATQRHMGEIEADAFIASFIPGAYASSFAILREVRKRIGTDWLQSKLKDNGEGLSVLDVGGGGAGISAWEQILQAEWDLLKEEGKVKGSKPPGRKTVVASSDRLRQRLKNIYQDTTFLPRLPDYEHSGEMRGPRLEGGDRELPRKSYDIIIASHMFLRESESHRRQAILNNLWHLLKKDGGVLVIVEKGHPRGFEAVAHARDTVIKNFLLPQNGQPRISPQDFNPTFHREPEPGQIIAPCTNHETCPMYTVPGKSRGRKDWCHFSQRFVRPNFTTKMLRKHADNNGEVQFSYVAIQRGVAGPARPTPEEATRMAQEGYLNSAAKPDMQTLPRLVLPSLKRTGHITLEVCTPEGKIERWIVPKSLGKAAYHDARKTRWGDLWALGAKTRVERKVRAGQTKHMLEQGEDANAKSAGKKQPRSKQQKRQEMIESLQRAEEEGIEEIADEIGEQVEAEVEMEEEAEEARRKLKNGRRRQR